MDQNSFRSVSDGNGTYRIANPIANPNFRGPDGVGNTAATNATIYVPAVKVTPNTQQAINYYNKMAANCKACQ